MPASSLVSNPTRTLGSVWRGSLCKTESSVAGLSFAAQPAAFAIAVNFKVSVKGTSTYRLYGRLLWMFGAAFSDITYSCLRTSVISWSYRTMPSDFLLIFFVLAVIVPWRGWARMQRLRSLTQISSRERIGLYLTAMASQWIITGVV